MRWHGQPCCDNHHSFALPLTISPKVPSLPELRSAQVQGLQQSKQPGDRGRLEGEAAANAHSLFCLSRLQSTRSAHSGALLSQPQGLILPIARVKRWFLTCPSPHSRSLNLTMGCWNNSQHSTLPPALCSCGLKSTHWCYIGNSASGDTVSPFILAISTLVLHLNFWGVGEGAVSRVTAAWARGPEFGQPAPTQKPVWQYPRNPSTCGIQRRDDSETCYLDTLANQWDPGSGKDIWHGSLSSTLIHMCTHTNTYT